MRDLFEKVGVVVLIAILIAFFLPILGLIVGIIGGIFFGASSIHLYVSMMNFFAEKMIGLVMVKPDGFNTLMVMLVWGALNMIGLAVMSQPSPR